MTEELKPTPRIAGLTPREEAESLADGIVFKNNVAVNNGDGSGLRVILGNEREERLLDALTDRIAANRQLRKQQNALAAAVKQAREQFNYYGDMHKAKGTREGDRKAAVNWALARCMDIALATLDEGRPMSDDEFTYIEERLNEGLHLIPHYMHVGVKRYVLQGIPPGGFLTAVICNDLKEAFARADDDNTAAMQNWVRFFCNYTPATCWGSPECFREWIKKHNA